MLVNKVVSLDMLPQIIWKDKMHILILKIMISNMLKILKYLLVIFVEYLKYPCALQNKKKITLHLKGYFKCIFKLLS